MIHVALDGIYFFCYATSAVYTTLEIIFIAALYWPDAMKMLDKLLGKS